MVQMRCLRCQYLFDTLQRRITICPNCGEKDAVEKEKSANELIKEIDF